jgi:hypothetical protein
VLIGLIGLLALDIARNRLWVFFRIGLGRFLLLAALANVGWWLFTLYRTSLVSGISVTHAASFGRDFLYVQLLIPLLAASFQRSHLRRAVLVTVGVWSVIPACALLLGTVSHGHFSSLLHPVKFRKVNGLTRIYTPVADLFPVAFELAAAVAVLGRSTRLRRYAALIALANLLALVAGQTRAQYLATAIGLLVAAAWSLRGPAARIAMRRMLAAAAGVAAILAFLLGAFPNSGPSHTISKYASRLGSVGAAASSNSTTTSTLAVRAVEAHTLEVHLGSHAILGLGFIDPRDHYDPNLPSGSIRNADVGLLNTVMTEGIIGTALYYLSLVAVTALLMRRRSLSGSKLAWANLGALAGCLTTIGASVTLVTFFTTTGIVVVALLVALGATYLAGSDESIAVSLQPQATQHAT